MGRTGSFRILIWPSVPQLTISDIRDLVVVKCMRQCQPLTVGGSVTEEETYRTDINGDLKDYTFYTGGATCFLQ